MDRDPDGPLPRVLDLDDPRQAEEALARWDELPSSALRLLRAHPEHGPRLERLWRAERWLVERAPAAPGATGVAGAPAAPAAPRLAAEAHPDAEELYDLGGGPGASPIAPPRRAAVASHVAACAACAELVGTLASSPPVPLLDAEPGASPATGRDAAERVRSPRDAAERALSPRDAAERVDALGAPIAPAELDAPVVQRASRRPRPLAWLPLAAAAGLFLAAGLGLLGRDAPETVRGGFPEAPLLRGASSDPLLWPRGRVLGAPAGAATPLAGAWSAAPRFELDPVAGAERYRIVLRRHGGDAFAEGETVLEASAAEPVLAGEPLAPGTYTWEAWARVDGLDRPLGSRDVQVVLEPGLAAELAALPAGSAGADALGSPLPPESAEAALALVGRLHVAGFWTDARRLARRLPASPERDAYLARKPGR